MGTNVQTPSAFRIIRSNFISAVVVIMILLQLTPYLLLIVYGVGLVNAITSDMNLILFGVVFVMGVLFLALKINYFKSTFQKAEEITGYITHVEFHRVNAHIEYEYAYRNEKYSFYDNVIKSEKTKYYKKGDAVTLMVDSEKPNKAIIRDIYV